MKGQSSIIGHTIAFGLSMSLVIVLVVALASIQNDYREFAVKNEIGKICGMVKGGVEKIYWPGEYASQGNVTMGKIIITLPEKIGGMNYRARMENTSLFVDVISPGINMTCELGFNASFTGRSDGGRTLIKWMILDGSNRIAIGKEE